MKKVNINKYLLNYKSYLLLLIILIIVLIIIPIMFEILFHKYLFDTKYFVEIREFYSNVFGGKEGLWTLSAGVITAVGIAIPIIYQIGERQKEERGLQIRINAGLSDEVRRNLDIVFEGDFEVPISKKYFELTKDNVRYLHQLDLCDLLAPIYNESDVYENIIRGKDHYFMSEKKTLQIINVIESFFKSLGVISKDDLQKVGQLKTQLLELSQRRTNGADPSTLDGEISDIRKKLKTYYEKNKTLIKKKVSKKINESIKPFFQ